MKLFKRLVIFSVGLVLVLALAAGGAYLYGVRAKPAWLTRTISSKEDQAAAANRLDQKILEAISIAREMDAAGGQTSQPIDASDKRPMASQTFSKLKVTFTEDELNASFQKWDTLYGWTDRYRTYVQDPSIVLHEGRIVLVGQSDQVGAVVSLHFEPKLDSEGKLSLQLSRVLAGRLPLPQAFFEKYRAAMRGRLQAALPDFQRKAQLAADGSANTDAMAAMMGRLMLHVFDNEPADPFLFLPVGQNRSMPVRLTAVNVEDKNLLLSVKPLNASERAALIEQIREPLAGETALGNSARPAPEKGS